MLAKALCNGDRVFSQLGRKFARVSKMALMFSLTAELARWQTEEDEEKALMLDGKKEKEK